MLVLAHLEASRDDGTGCFFLHCFFLFSWMDYILIKCRTPTVFLRVQFSAKKHTQAFNSLGLFRPRFGPVPIKEPGSGSTTVSQKPWWRSSWPGSRWLWRACPASAPAWRASFLFPPPVSQQLIDWRCIVSSSFCVEDFVKVVNNPLIFNQLSFCPMES